MNINKAITAYLFFFIVALWFLVFTPFLPFVGEETKHNLLSILSGRYTSHYIPLSALIIWVLTPIHIAMFIWLDKKRAEAYIFLKIMFFIFLFFYFFIFLFMTLFAFMFGDPHLFGILHNA